MKRVVIKLKYGNPDTLIVPGDCFDMHEDFIYVGSGGDIVGMFRADSIEYIYIVKEEI